MVTPTRCESPCLWRSPRPVPNGLCERGDSRSSFRGARHGSCHRPYSATPLCDEVQPRTGYVLVKPSPPPVHERYRSIPAGLRVLWGRRTNLNHVLPTSLWTEMVGVEPSVSAGSDPESSDW